MEYLNFKRKGGEWSRVDAALTLGTIHETQVSPLHGRQCGALFVISVCISYSAMQNAGTTGSSQGQLVLPVPVR